MKFVIDEFNKSSPNYDIYEKPKLLKRLRIECRKAKESLSFSNNSVNIHVRIAFLWDYYYFISLAGYKR